MASSKPGTPKVPYLQWLLLLTISQLSTANGTCSFPDFVQSGSGKDWRSHIKGEYSEFTLTINVTAHKISVVSTDASATSYERICVLSVSNNKFVTLHEERRQRGQQYVCVEFLQRSASVLQLRVSDARGSMSGICDDDQLHTDPWIWVDRNNILASSTICPLTGGFSVKLFVKEYNRGLCDAYDDHVWVESECVEGTGIYFNFRQTRCIPPILMYTQEWTTCAANWTESGYNFALLRHRSRPTLWILRFPSDYQHRSGFVAHLMKDLYAATGNHITELDTYIQMDMVRNTPQPVSSLCIDEFEGCSYYGNPCGKGTDLALTCARTCGVCNETRPVVCGFDQDWQGDWIDASHGDRVASTFQPQTLTVYYNKIQRKFYCIRWDEPYSGAAPKHTMYRMLVSEFQNGCRPQYSCVKITHRASSPVMFLQLSDERHWPFTNTIADPVSCDHFVFDGDSNTLVPNRYRSKHHKLLYSKSQDTGTTCRMPVSDVTNYTVTLSDETLCSGSVRKSNSVSSVIVSISRCESDSFVVRSVPREHTCVESSRLFTRDLLVVTRTDEEPFDLYCWLFPRRTKDVFYLVEAAHCNDNTKKRITRGHMVPLAAFSTKPPSPRTSLSDLVVHSTPNHTLQEARDNLSPSGEHSVFEINNNSNTIQGYDKNSTNNNQPIHPASYVSPIVIIAAVLFIVMFQIPCMCKKS